MCVGWSFFLFFFFYFSFQILAEVVVDAKSERQLHPLRHHKGWLPQVDQESHIAARTYPQSGLSMASKPLRPSRLGADLRCGATASGRQGGRRARRRRDRGRRPCHRIANGFLTPEEVGGVDEKCRARLRRTTMLMGTSI